MPLNESFDLCKFSHGISDIYTIYICIFFNLISCTHLQIFLSTRWAILLNLHAEMFRTNTYPAFCVWYHNCLPFINILHEFFQMIFWKICNLKIDNFLYVYGRDPVSYKFCWYRWKYKLLCGKCVVLSDHDENLATKSCTWNCYWKLTYSNTFF